MREEAADPERSATVTCQYLGQSLHFCHSFAGYINYPFASLVTFLAYRLDPLSLFH